MKRALLVASIEGFIASFEMNNIKLLQEMGYEVHVACNEIGTKKNHKEQLSKAGVIIHQVDFARNPFSKSNLNAYKQIKKILEKENIQIVHCHTPVAGVISRICARKYRKKGLKVIYTAHGFHFYKGAPKKNWLLFYPIEKICSSYTDLLIVINKSDYALASNKMKAKQIVYIPGVGINTAKFNANQNLLEKRSDVRRKLGIPSKGFLLLSVGELNENKNHEAVIRALSQIKGNATIYYIVAGDGHLIQFLNSLISELSLDERVVLLGYRTDVPELLAASDLYILPSLREGLNMSLMEAMAAGKPILCGNIRGNIDLIDEGYGGYLFNPNKIEDMANCINSILLLSEDERKQLGDYNKKKVTEFDVSVVSSLMKKYYTL